jgi:ABC-type polysaccharide/polyol phosphate export permease
MDFNPLFYMIQVVRGPLLGHPPEWGIWLGALVSAAASLTLGLAIYGRFRHRVAFWL